MLKTITGIISGGLKLKQYQFSIVNRSFTFLIDILMN